MRALNKSKTEFLTPHDSVYARTVFVSLWLWIVRRKTATTIGFGRIHKIACIKSNKKLLDLSLRALSGRDKNAVTINGTRVWPSFSRSTTIPSVLTRIPTCHPSVEQISDGKCRDLGQRKNVDSPDSGQRRIAEKLCVPNVNRKSH